jgi:hypothetical protein
VKARALSDRVGAPVRRGSVDGRSKKLIRACNRRPCTEPGLQNQAGKDSARPRQIEHPRILRVMALTTHGTATIVFVARVVVRGRRARRCSSAAVLDGPRVARSMAGTVSRFHPVFLRLRQGRGSMRHLPLQADGELKHQQCCDHPVCRSVAHDSGAYTRRRDERSSVRAVDSNALQPARALDATLAGRRRQFKRLQWQFVSAGPKEV